MNILFFSEYFPESSGTDISGGVEARCFNIAKALAEKNKVTLITSWIPGLKRHDVASGIKIIRVGPEHKYSNQGGFLSRVFFVAYAIREGLKHKETDIVDGQNFTTYYPAYMVAKKLRKPCVITYHETWIGEWVKNKGLITGLPYEFYEKMLLKLKVNRIISVSGFTKKKLAERGIPTENISVIHNGINLDDFDFRCKKERMPSICYIGRLVETKKADVFIRAISILKKDFPKIRCSIIGRGNEKEKLEKLAESLNLKDNVSFLGFIKDTKEVRRILKSHALFCLPSVVEGFGIVLLEAMASGVPYVCSDIDVFKEITENGKGGLIFKRNNEKNLAEKIKVLLKSKKTYNKKRREGKKLVKKYQWKKLSSDVENTYEEVINKYTRKKRLG
jgi:glycosyltransferase involved in cell wall biosynthesis